MSKKLRVIFLSVLVVVLGAVSAMAADLPTYRITFNSAGVDPYTATVSHRFVDADGELALNEAGRPIGSYTPNNGFLYINANGVFTFDDDFIKSQGAPVIDRIILDYFDDGEVTDAAFVVPTPFPTDAPSEGTKGTWFVTWPSVIKNSLGIKVSVSNVNRVKFTIQKRSTNSAILVVDGADNKNNLFGFSDPRPAPRGLGHAKNGATVRQVREGWDFVLNAPIRVNQTTNNQLEVITTVRDGGTFTFDREAEIFANRATPNTPTGYTLASALASNYTVYPGGEMIIRNEYALRGRNLTVDVYPGEGVLNSGERAKLTLDLPSGTKLDLRGVGDTDGVVLRVDGSFNVLSDMTLYGEIITRGQYQPTNNYVQDPTAIAGTLDTIGTTTLPNFQNNNDLAGAGNGNANALRQTFFKTGSGKLTLHDKNNFEKPSLRNSVRFVNVEEGGLELKSNPTWWAGGSAIFNNVLPAVTPTVTVFESADFIANTNTIVDDNADTTRGVNSVAFIVNGTATFGHHAISKKDDTNAVFNEIYPYEDFVTFNNGLLINARDISLTIGDNGKVVIDNGAFAAGKIAGTGTIEIKNDDDPSRDKAVLILTEPFGTDNANAAAYRAGPTPITLNAALTHDYYARSYIDFEGTIKGANLGLYTPFATDIPYSRRIFQRAKSVDLENLIVYGPAQLNVDANTKLDGVKNIWLRAHRPGAMNYDNGTVNTSVAYSKLTIGKLNFIPGERNSDIYINSLKVDGSSSYEDMGAVNVLYVDNDATNNAQNRNNNAIAVAVDRNDNIVAAPANGANPLANTAPRDYSAMTAAIATLLPVDADENGAFDDFAAIRQGVNRDTMAVGPRLNAHINNLHLYANSGPNKDFPKDGFYNPSNGIYALRLNGTARPSRILIDGTKVDGDGLAADFDAKFYQIEITGKSDVRFTGPNSGDYEPLAKNNSMKVKQDAKLTIDRGAVVEGHLAFEPSSRAVWPTFGRHWVWRDFVTVLGIVTHQYWAFNSAYPADEDFISDEGWYDGFLSVTNGFAFTNNGRVNGPRINNTLHGPLMTYLDNYTAFSTQVDEKNRRTNSGGEYAVKVKGDLTLARDEFEGYSGRGQVLVRAMPDLTVYENTTNDFTTIGERFKVIGEAEDGGTYTDDYATSYNRFFLFRTLSAGADTDGVTVGNRDELARVNLGDWAFMKGKETFGMGDGYNFSVQIPFSVTYRGENINIERVVDEHNNIHYYVGLGGEKYEIKGRPVFFNYTEGMSSSNENVSDITALTTLFNIDQLDDNSIYVSDDIDVRAEFEIVTDSDDNIVEQFVRLIGTSYSGTAPVNLRVALYLLEVTGEGVVDWLDGVIPGFKDVTLVRNGGGIPTPAPTPTSQDVPAPTSPDTPAPVSPDNPAPTSPDNPAPTSPDNPAPTPPAPTFGIELGDASTMDDGDDLIAGRTYSMVFTAENASGAVTWRLTDNTNGKVLHSSATTGSTFIVEGTFTATENEQTFSVTATDAEGHTETYDVTISSVEAEDPEIASAYTTLPATSGSHNDVKAGYRVNFPTGVTADPDYVFLPSWLKAVLNDDDEVVGIAFAGVVDGLKNGTTATVTVEEAENEDGDTLRYQWPVVYGAESSSNGNGGNGGTTSPDVPSPTSPDTPAPTSGDHTVSSSSSSGCDAGFGAFALLFAAPLFLRRRRS